MDFGPVWAPAGSLPAWGRWSSGPTSFVGVGGGGGLQPKGSRARTHLPRYATGAQKPSLHPAHGGSKGGIEKPRVAPSLPLTRPLLRRVKPNPGAGVIVQQGSLALGLQREECTYMRMIEVQHLQCLEEAQLENKTEGEPSLGGTGMPHTPEPHTWWPLSPAGW